MIARKRPPAGVTAPPAGATHHQTPGGWVAAGTQQAAPPHLPPAGRGLLHTLRTVASDVWFGVKVAVPVAVIIYLPIVFVIMVASRV